MGPKILQITVFGANLTKFLLKLLPTRLHVSSRTYKLTTDFGFATATSRCQSILKI